MNIYIITNKVNGMKYVDITDKDFEAFLKEYHMKAVWSSDSRKSFYHDLISYGLSNFSLELVKLVDSRDQAIVEYANLVEELCSDIGDSNVYNKVDNYSPCLIPSEIVLVREILTNGLVSAPYYRVGSEVFASKPEVLDYLKFLGIEISMTILNMIIGNHMVPKSVTSKYPNFRFVDNLNDNSVEYYYN